MSIRSIFFTSLFSICIAAPVFAVGCAAPTGSEDDAEEELADAQDDLTAAGKQLVGTYYGRAVTGGFARLELKANGKYAAEVDPDGKIVCITSPCLLPESGTWSASKTSRGGYRLRVNPAGGASRRYEASKTTSPAGLELARSGVTEVLRKLGANQCLDNDDCSSTQECGPRMCRMFCLVGDPFCCAPSTCQAKPKPTPATCGRTTCGAGLVCCNPLAGICTKPGEVCIQ